VPLAITASTSQEERKNEKRIILYRLLDDKLVGKLPTKRFGSFAFSPDGRYLATAYSTGGGGSGDIFGYYSSSQPRYSNLVLWQLFRQGDRYYPQPIQHLKSKKDSYSPLVFSPDGTILANGGYKKISLWRMPLIHPWLLKMLLIIGFSGVFLYGKRFFI
jgi:WD40 repeat protein